MKTIFTIILGLALLLPLQLNAQTASKIPSITFGEQVFTDVRSTDFWLAAAGNTSAYSTFRVLDGTNTDYQIPASTNLRIIGVRLENNAAASSSGIIGYADVASENGTYASHTNPVSINTGSTTPGAFELPFTSAAGKPGSYYVNWLLTGLSTKYIFGGADSSTWKIWIYVREETP